MDDNRSYTGDFPRRLRLLFDETRVSQQEVADYVGVSRQAVAQWKDGKTIPDMYNFKKVAEFFKVPYEYLYGDTGSRVRENMALSDTLGLSDKAIEVLQAIHKNSSFAGILSEIIEDKRFLNALEYLGQAVDEYRKFQQSYMQKTDGGDYMNLEYEESGYAGSIGKSIIGADKMAAFCLYQSVDMFRQIIGEMPEEKYLQSVVLTEKSE